MPPLFELPDWKITVVEIIILSNAIGNREVRRIQEIGDKRQESGDRSQETGDRSQEIE
jgi:hypothetical protein